MKTKLERYTDASGKVAYKLVPIRITGGLDLDFFLKTDGVGRDTVESRLRAVVEALRDALADVEERDAQITTLQEHCTKQLGELRTRRALSTLADTEEGKFLAEGMHEPARARAKYPGPESLETLLMVICEESGETTRAHLHKEGHARIREEAAQVVATCCRLAVEGLAPKEGA